MMLYSPECKDLVIDTSDNSAGDLDVSFDGGTTWAAMEKLSATTARVTVKGPDATPNPAGVVALALGVFGVVIRYSPTDRAIIDRLDDHLWVVPIPEQPPGP